MRFFRVAVVTVGLFVTSFGIVKASGSPSPAPSQSVPTKTLSHGKTATPFAAAHPRTADASSDPLGSNLYLGPPYFLGDTFVCRTPPVLPLDSTIAQAANDLTNIEDACGYCPTTELSDYYPNGSGSTVAVYVWAGPSWECGPGGGYIDGTEYYDDPTKNLGDPGCDCAGDPINLGTGNEYRDEIDEAEGDLSLHRYYNSDASVASAHIGAHWRHSFDRSLEYLPAVDTPPGAVVLRPDGRQVVFTLTSGVWTPDLDVPDQLTQQVNGSDTLLGWTFTDAATRNVEGYDANGNLISITNTRGQVTSLTYSNYDTPPSVAPGPNLLLTVTDSQGRTLIFAYNSKMNVATVTLPDAGVLTYTYDTAGNLSAVQYPDTSTRQFEYNESSLTGGNNLPNALTGVTDETNTRFASITYDSQGRGTMSSLAGGAETTSLTFNSDFTTSVTYPLGASTTLSFVVPNGSVHANSVSAPCGPTCGQTHSATTFDANGYPASTTDFKGNINATTYDVNGLLDQEVDASGAPSQRTTNTTWNTSLRVPLARSVLDANGITVATTQWVYNAIGQPLARCEIAPTVTYTCAVAGTPPAGVRRWTYSYCTTVDTTECPVTGLLLSVDGPRTDVADTTTYAYYLTDTASSQHGDLKSVTDPLGHVTTYLTYDGAGRVETLQDPNGVVTTLSYTPRGWLHSRSVGGATTTLGYTPYGAVASITDPDSVITTFTYDAAHRLTDVTDAQGNDIHYTLDAAGDKTAEQTRTASGTVVRSLSRTYNALGQLTAIVDGLSHTVFNAGTSGNYDANGNLVQSADALGYQRQQSFDALNRLTSTIANYNGAEPATTNTTTTVSLDALDRTAAVTDPTALSTSYSYDGLSNRIQLQSPDTGTSTDTFDAAGNRLTHADAKGIVSTSTYDALNRPISTSYTDTTQNVSYTYDEANTVTGCSTSNPIGRLTRVVEGTVTTTFCYDGRGNIIEKMQQTSANTDITRYSYTSANRLSGETTPDQTAISYAFDSDGRISGVQVTPSGATSAPPTAVSAISYLPFGPISSYTLGNGQVVTRTYDANYRLTDLTSPALNLHFARDAMGNIVALGNAPGASPATETYSYDPLYRLTGITDSGTTLESYLQSGG
jgi:YD repeat-containing protein